MIVHIDKLIRHLRSQIESATKLDSEFVYITRREAEGCLELAEAQDVIQEMLSEKSRIVRCKDCRHWIGGGIDNRDNFIPPRCTLFNEPQSADWYCPAGQRKETE